QHELGDGRIRVPCVGEQGAVDERDAETTAAEDGQSHVFSPPCRVRLRFTVVGFGRSGAVVASIRVGKGLTYGLSTRYAGSADGLGRSRGPPRADIPVRKTRVHYSGGGAEGRIEGDPGERRTRHRLG